MDYSKPIGWWCTSCGREYTAPTWHDPTGFRHIVETLDGRNCNGGLCIPVYAVIPEGQRPEADEPEPEAVCRLVSGGGPDDLLSDVARIPRFHRFALEAPSGGFVAADTTQRIRHGLTLADAVLWVAEGVLP